MIKYNTHLVHNYMGSFEVNFQSKNIILTTASFIKFPCPMRYIIDNKIHSVGILIIINSVN